MHDEPIGTFRLGPHSRLPRLARHGSRPVGGHRLHPAWGHAYLPVVAAHDAGLFGRWWHEGPAWPERVRTALPAAGIGVTTLRASSRPATGARVLAGVA